MSEGVEVPNYFILQRQQREGAPTTLEEEEMELTVLYVTNSTTLDCGIPSGHIIIACSLFVFIKLVHRKSVMSLYSAFA